MKFGAFLISKAGELPFMKVVGLPGWVKNPKRQKIGRISAKFVIR